MDEKQWTPIAPIPRSLWEEGADGKALLPPLTIVEGCAGYWAYHNEKGELLCYRVRFNRSDGGKDVPPLTFCRDKEGKGEEWRFKSLPCPLPLYELPRLAGSPAIVLVCEGEKAADCGQSLFPDWSVTTWQGGTGAITHADWRPLRILPGTVKIVAWPDNDEQGILAMSKLPELLGKPVQMVQPSGDWPQGADLVDLKQTGWQPGNVLEWIEKHSAIKYPQSTSIEFGTKLIDASKVVCRQVSWLWPDRIPLAKHTLVAGDPGLGKSLVTLDLAARVSAGIPFPDGTSAFPASHVVLLSGEDDPSDTIVPRLNAAGADANRITLVQGVHAVTKSGDMTERAFSLESDISLLHKIIESRQAKLIVIDPISAFLGNVDGNSNSQVRSLLAPLAWLAADLECAILTVTHLRKSGGSALHRIAESLAFSAAARSVWTIAADPYDKARRLFVPVKANLSRFDVGGLGYRIEDVNGIAKVAWEDKPVIEDADELVEMETSEQRHGRREAIDFLKELLANGPVGSTTLFEQAHARGFSRETLRRAGKALGIVPKQSQGYRHGGWTWALPDHKPPQEELGLT
jgi:hypothetical protein